MICLWIWRTATPYTLFVPSWVLYHFTLTMVPKLSWSRRFARRHKPEAWVWFKLTLRDVLCGSQNCVTTAGFIIAETSWRGLFHSGNRTGTSSTQAAAPAALVVNWTIRSRRSLQGRLGIGRLTQPPLTRRSKRTSWPTCLTVGGEPRVKGLLWSQWRDGFISPSEYKSPTLRYLIRCCCYMCLQSTTGPIAICACFGRLELYNLWRTR